VPDLAELQPNLCFIFGRRKMVRLKPRERDSVAGAHSEERFSRQARYRKVARCSLIRVRYSPRLSQNLKPASPFALDDYLAVPRAPKVHRGCFSLGSRHA
jgi:hypothetical protein